MNKNTVLSLPQMTVDYTFMVPEHIESICGEFVNREFFSPEVREVLLNIKNLGLKQDHLLPLDSDDSRSSQDFGGALEYLRTTYPKTELAQVGGNPAIAALRGYYLGVRDRDPSLPIVRYAGIYTASLAEFIEKQKEPAPYFHSVLEQVFDKELCFQVDDKPMSLALEGHHKVIIAYGPGRRLDCIKSSGSFSDYLGRLTPTVPPTADRKVLFAFCSVPHPLELGGELIDKIKEQFGAQALIFVGCSSFRKGNTPNFERTSETWKFILKKADILSMNETELGDLHTVVVGKGTHQDKPLSYKLLELPTEAIKVCHGADGSLMDPGPDPGRVINAAQFVKDPAAFLQETLRLATDGATYGIAALFGHDATEAGVRIFSATVPNRNTERFRATFLNVLESMPPGLIAVHTPVVARTMSALTGVGARFDGLLVTFLMRS